MIPYAQLAGAGVLVLLVVGIIYVAYRWGRATERAKGEKAALELGKAVQDAVRTVRADTIRVDREWLRGSRDADAAPRPDPPRAPGDRRSGQPPDA